MSDELTRPEKAVAFSHARAAVKKIIGKGAACTICQHRKDYFGTDRCRTNPARMFPLCGTDGNAPAFELDEKKLEGIIHG